ncbi:hypothetical protein NDU88_006852 [Pleurodeles waltl]|uniref:Uncharacterized protein n=1 Tax=Pleurodeles waltl TaxID=8319 RepID=A0AAV7QMC5_PLEWA|nr:hypothetical protein NDU88_006852 [Pleurodeles waltl]
MPARRSPDGALVPPENRSPASGFPVSRAQMPNPMPKCRCDQGVKHALCGQGSWRTRSVFQKALNAVSPWCGCWPRMKASTKERGNAVHLPMQE